jgi:hypothetical protein
VIAKPEEDASRSWHFKQLRWSLQALAVAGSVQRSLFPDAVVTADELALDFDHWASFIRENYLSELTESRAESIAAIERKLTTMSRDGAEFDLELWTDAALGTSEHWAEIRGLAALCLEAFGWPVEALPEQPGDPGNAIAR